MATSRRTGNYSTSAKAVIRASDQIFDAAMSGKPDFTKISETAIKARSMERRAATKAEGEVASAGIRAARDVKGYKYKADALIEQGKRKGGKARMAGALGALGSLAGGFVMKSGQDKQDALDAKRDAESKAWQEEMLEVMSRPTPKPEELPAPPVMETPDLETPGSGSSSSSSSTPSVSMNISANHSFDPSKVMNREQITALAESVGFSPEASQTVYGIAGGESGFDPTNSTKRSGLYDKTGEDSVGLMQINWGYHKDKGWLQNMGITSREQLLDPTTNMKAAKYLYDGRGGGFQDWTVYNKGIYRDYL